MPGKGNTMPVKSYKDRNGKTKYYSSFYYSDYTGQRIRKKKEGFATAAAAKQFEKDFLEQHSGSSDILFRNLAANYMKDCAQRLKPTTMQAKKVLIDGYVLPYFGDLPISEIEPLHVRNWQNQLLKGDHSPGSLRMIHSNLSAILTFGVKYYGLPRNPATLAGSMGTLKRQKEIHFYTLDQFRQFLPFVREQFRLPLKILFYTGLRIGELLALTINDFDPAAGTLDINKTKSSTLKIIQSPKTAKSKRIVTLPEFLIHEISNYIAARFYDPQPQDELFYWLVRNTLSTEIHNAAKLAELPQIRLHDLRHSHASLLISMNVPPLAVSERLGHETIKTTLEIYSHLYPGTAASIAKKLDEFKI